MDPVTILDHYRIPLVHNREAVQALARLLRDGPQNSAALAESLRSAPPETNRLLTSLYRAALVRKPGADLWSVSPLGEQVLEGLHVLDVAAADLLESLADTEADRRFLKTWMRHSAKDRDSRACLSLLRSLRQIETSDTGTGSILQAVRAPLLYAIVIAADPWVQRAGKVNVWEAIARGHGTKFLESAGNAAPTGDDAETITAAWQAGMTRYHDSNRLLLFAPDEPSDHRDKETVRFTWLRAVDAAMRGSADEGLRASCSRWQSDDATGFWKFMFKQHSVEQQTRTLCRQQGWLDQPTLTEELLAELAERLLKAIGETGAGKQPDLRQIEGWFGGDDLQTLVLGLQRVSDDVERDGVGVVPDDVRGALSDALDRLVTLLQRPHRPRGTE